MNKGIVAVVLLVAGIWATSAFALDPMGPPAAGIGTGMWDVGALYSYSDMKVESSLGNFVHDGPIVPESRIKLKINKVYVNLGYGVADNVDLFGRLGVAWVDKYRRPDRADWEGDSDLGDDPVLGLGIKATLAESSDVKWGVLGQYSFADIDGDQEDPARGDGHFKLRLNELQIAAGPTWKASEKVSVYGGPFIHLVSGKLEDENASGDKNRHPLGEESFLGGYVGAAVMLAENTNLTVELQATGEAWAIAGGVGWKF